MPGSSPGVCVPGPSLPGVVEGSVVFVPFACVTTLFLLIVMVNSLSTGSAPAKGEMLPMSELHLPEEVLPV